MTLAPAFLDELRERTNLSGLISRTVRLQKAGNEFKACCPFHKEKSASFYVNDEKGFAHCFGCGFHCDAIGWLTETRGMEFLEAVRELTAAAGMEMPERTPGQSERDEQARGVHEVLSRAAAWFADQLQGIDGAAARAYLDERGVDQATARAFGLGFAPDSRGRLRSALANDGDAALIEAGLLAAPEGRDPYDRFRGRLMFPIHDARGRVIAFSGRIIGPGEPKYLNSPETSVFDKGRTLFNLHRAAAAGRRSGRLVVVEGQMDVIGLAQAGVEEVVAPLGTALTETQIALLWRVSGSPIICFDGDAAGRRAGVKAAARALPGITVGRTLRFVGLPAGKDPDDIAKSGGKAAVEALLAAPMALADLLWRHELEAAPLTTPDARAGLRQRLAGHTEAIENADLRREYEREFKERLYQAFRPPPFVKGKQRPTPPKGGPPPSPSGMRRRMVTAILRGCARFPVVTAGYAESIATLPVETDAQRAARDILLDAVFTMESIDAAAVDELFPDDRGWHGFSMSFLRPSVPPARAEADLVLAIEAMAAEAAGATREALVKMVSDYRPPEPPPPGSLV
ncbi:MAG: DNA primase [Allosphingosinicella sp.]